MSLRKEFYVIRVYDRRGRFGKVITDPKEGDRGFLRGRIPVTFYVGLGWLTEEEVLNMRQTEPRTAP